jgi:hypothetical protein
MRTQLAARLATSAVLLSILTLTTSTSRAQTPSVISGAAGYMYPKGLSSGDVDLLLTTQHGFPSNPAFTWTRTSIGIGNIQSILNVVQAIDINGTRIVKAIDIDGARVVQRTYNSNAPSQKWASSAIGTNFQANPRPGPRFMVQNASNGLCMTSGDSFPFEDSTVRLANCNGPPWPDNQLWYADFF